MRSLSINWLVQVITAKLSLANPQGQLNTTFLSFLNDPTIVDPVQLNALLNNASFWSDIPDLTHLSHLTFNATLQEWEAAVKHYFDPKKQTIGVTEELFSTQINNQNGKSQLIITPKKLTDKPMPQSMVDFISKVNRTQKILNRVYLVDYFPGVNPVQAMVNMVSRRQQGANQANNNNLSQLNEQIVELKVVADGGNTLATVDSGGKELMVFQQDVVTEKWWEKRTPFIQKFGRLNLTFLSIAVLLVILLDLLNKCYPNLFDFSNISYQYTRNLLICLMGTSIGAWLSFVFVKRKIVFEDFNIMSEKIQQPRERFYSVLLISAIVYLLLLLNVINFKIADSSILDTKNIGYRNYETFAFVIGVILGFSESTVGKSLVSRFKKLGENI